MDVTGEAELPAGVEMVMPGDRVNLQIKLIVPVALEVGSHRDSRGWPHGWRRRHQQDY